MLCPDLLPSLTCPSTKMLLTKMKLEIKSIEFWRCVITECLGTFFYVFVPCLATLDWSPGVINVLGVTSSDLVHVSLCFGLTLGVLTQCFGHISGCHVNPAVTLATLVTCKMTPLRGFLYIVAQCGGGIAGAALLFGIAPPGYRGSLGVTSLHDSVTPSRGFGLEFLFTFILVLTYCATTDPSRRNQGSHALPMALVVTLTHLTGHRLTGSSSNPARSLGPAFISNSWGNHWVYWVGPLSGGFIAAILYEYIFDPFRRTKSVEDVLRDSDLSSSTRNSEPTTYGFNSIHSNHMRTTNGTISNTNTITRPSCGRPRGLENVAYEASTHAHLDRYFPGHVTQEHQPALFTAKF